MTMTSANLTKALPSLADQSPQRPMCNDFPHHKDPEVYNTRKTLDEGRKR